MDTFITHPRGAGPFPAVILYMDIWGVREELFDIARRIATVGYYCMVPDLYYRQGKVRHEFRNERNQTISSDLLDERRREMARASREALTDAMVVRDTQSLLDFIDHGEPVRSGAMGCLGYCMGGRHVFLVAARFPQRFRASVSLHGTSLVTDRPESPHRLAGKLMGELYCGFAEKDRNATPATLQAMDEAFSNRAVKYRHEVHSGADHGYALPDRDVYDKQAANRDWELIFAMFRRQIPPSSE